MTIVDRLHFNTGDKMIKKESKFTLHGRYNHETLKPYVEIKKDGEHYCYSPYSIWKNVAERSVK